MRVVRVRDAERSGDEGRLAYLDEDGIRPLPEGTTLIDALGARAAGADVAPLPAGGLEALPLMTGLVSLRDCVGFLDHVRNARRARGVEEPLSPVWSARPAFYFANPASIRTSTAPIQIPAGCTAFDFEFEVGVILGSGGRDLSVDEAAGCIAGYVLYCDWSARDIQSEERVMQIGQGKAKDAAISLGPWVLDAAEAERYRTPDGFDFEASIQVNGTLVHAAPFRGMDWSFEELVAYASLGSEVRAGDIIASGTLPLGCLMEHSGTDDFRGWLQPGDVVRLDGGPLGVIESRIEEAPPAPAWRRPQAAAV